MTPPAPLPFIIAPLPLALAVGTRIGSYEVVSRLGAGGMGEVYRAHDASLKEPDVRWFDVSPDGRLLACATGSSTRPQINSVSVSLNPLSVDAPSVVLAESGEQGLSFATFDVGADGRLLMGKKADPLPGDEARMVLIEHGLPALKK